MKYKYSYNNHKKDNTKIVIISVIIIFVALIISLFVFRKNSFVSKINNIILKPVEFLSNLNFIDNISESIATKKTILNQNKELIEENTNLSLKLLEYEKLIKENESLRKLLQIQEVFQHYTLIPAQIIIRSHDNYTKTFTIDVGEKDNVKEGQTVVHKDGLVGYISSTTENTAVVVTILDPKTSVSVKIPNISTPAVLAGNLEMKNKNNLKLESLQIGSEVSIGDIVYTSGLGDMYPSSIPIAKIISSNGKKTDSSRYAICEPLVEISNINEVAVIIKDSEVYE